MFLALAAILAALAIAPAVEIAKALRWRDWPRARRWTLYGTPLVAGALVAAWFGIHDPVSPHHNNGFGPEWSCHDPGTGEPVCIKQTPAAP
ncbi:hypothetical protein [Oleomonas cavernae]|uniref:hypothetical protein n=1 Tax=Oleomonas cavernae TaxID=2320859 RepID=UPI0011C46B53|nr:hypothetical protein [Oleomonas cavernae]